MEKVKSLLVSFHNVGGKGSLLNAIGDENFEKKCNLTRASPSLQLDTKE